MACYIRMRSTAAVAIILLLLLASQAAVSGEPQTVHVRKLLNISGESVSHWTEWTEPDSCSEEDVVVYQNNAEHLPSGIPTYSVEIINVCASCTVYNVHVSCGEFASTELVDPSQFQRVGFHDCLVKGGGRMGPSESVSFLYSNSFPYSLEVTNVDCE